LSSSNTITLKDIDTIIEIIAGCTKHVYRYTGQEDQWYNRITNYRHRIMKPSKKLLAQISIVKSPLDLRISPKQLESKFSEQIDHETASHALTNLTKVNYLQESQDVRAKRPGKPKKDDVENIPPGPKSIYTISNDVLNLKNFVERAFPRAVIYQHLLKCDVLEQFLKFHHYSGMIRIKYTDPDEMVRIEKAKRPIDEKSLDKFKKKLEQHRCLLNQKNDKEIMLDASKKAKQDVRGRDWKCDPLYTEFFILGGLCYPVIEQSNVQA
jgi:hypothetical protein